MIYLLLLLYAYKHGQTNAFLYSLKGANSLERNEHVDLVIERGLVVLAVITACFYTLPLLLLELAASILAFSFWHNGAYYVMRHQIARGKDEARYLFWNLWKWQSKSTTARFDFSYKQRLMMKLASIGILIGGYVWAL
jgi:hypothetical protein